MRSAAAAQTQSAGSQQWQCGPGAAEIPPRRLRSSSCTGRLRDRASNSLDDALAEQTLRPEQQEDERDDVGEPALDAGAEQRTPVEFTDLLADTDDHAADDGTGDRREAAEDKHRQRLKCDDLQRERNIRARAPHDAGC